MILETLPVTTTNGFHVTSEAAFRRTVDRIVWDSGSKPIVEVDDEGRCRFYNCAALQGMTGRDGERVDEEDVYEALQRVVAPGDAIVITELGTSTVSPDNALVTIITSDMIDYACLRNFAEERVRRVARNPDFILD